MPALQLVPFAEIPRVWVLVGQAQVGRMSDWKAVRAENGGLIYHNFKTGVSRVDLPQGVEPGPPTSKVSPLACFPPRPSLLLYPTVAGCCNPHHLPASANIRPLTLGVVCSPVESEQGRGRAVR